MYPRETIRQFDVFLADRGLQFEATVVGGAALGLLGVTSRQTRDADILQPELPPEVRAAARDFAVARRREGDVLATIGSITRRRRWPGTCPTDGSSGCDRPSMAAL